MLAAGPFLSPEALQDFLRDSTSKSHESRGSIWLIAVRMIFILL